MPFVPFVPCVPFVPFVPFAPFSAIFSQASRSTFLRKTRSAFFWLLDIIYGGNPAGTLVLWSQADAVSSTFLVDLPGPFCNTRHRDRHRLLDPRRAPCISRCSRDRSLTFPGLVPLRLCGSTFCFPHLHCLILDLAIVWGNPPDRFPS